MKFVDFDFQNQPKSISRKISVAEKLQNLQTVALSSNFFSYDQIGIQGGVVQILL